MKKIIAVSLVFVVAGAIVSVRAADAKQIYDKDSGKCHGEDGKGKTKMGEKLGAKDYSDAKVQDAMKDADMAKAIEDGVKDGDKVKMKGFADLSDDEIKSLVAY